MIEILEPIFAWSGLLLLVLFFSVYYHLCKNYAERYIINNPANVENK